jgi:iron complex transport system ATP-binding protein
MTPLAELEDVAFAYPPAPGRRARPFTLAGVSVAIGPGEIVGVIGPNSAGKTTLIRLLCGVLVPSRGRVLLEGRPVVGLGRTEVARHVAVVTQDTPAGLPFTVGEVVLMGRYPHGPARYFESTADVAVAREAMAVTGVLELAGVPLERLSGGERQRVMLARALAQRPRLLVLDEPTAHLDLRYQLESVALLRRLNAETGVAIIVVSHDLNLAGELADRLLLLAEGRVARLGAPAAVLDEALLAGVYGCPVVVTTHPSTGRPMVQLAWPTAPRR